MIVYIYTKIIILKGELDMSKTKLVIKVITLIVMVGLIASIVWSGMHMLDQQVVNNEESLSWVGERQLI